MVMGVSYSGSWPAAMECNGSSPIVCSCIVQTGGTWPGVNATVGISLNTWAHVACVYDGSKIRIYINGALNNSATATGTIDSGSNWVEVGWDVNDNGDRYPGVIDDVRFYNRALSAAEITQAMNMPVAP